MMVESYSNNHCQQIKTKNIHMAVNKLNIKQNVYPSTNENRTDDDYGGGGDKTALEISS